MTFSAPVCSLLSLLHTSLTSLIFSMQLLLFGGHGTGGWLSRYDVYYNDTIILDRGRFLLTRLFRSVSCSKITKISY